MQLHTKLDLILGKLGVEVPPPPVTGVPEGESMVRDGEESSGLLGQSSTTQK